MAAHEPPNDKQRGPVLHSRQRSLREEVILREVAHDHAHSLRAELAKQVPPYRLRGLRAVAEYSEEVLLAGGHRLGQRATEDLIRRKVNEAMLSDVFDPTNPTDVQLIRSHATSIALRELERLDHLFAERYGNAIIDLRVAGSLADDVLITTAKHFESRMAELRNLWAYVTRVAHNMAVKLADAALRAHAPGAHAHWRRLKHEINLSRDADPHLSDDERFEKAVASADEFVGRSGFVERSTPSVNEHGEYEDPIDSIPWVDEGFNLVESAGVIASINAIVLAELDTRDQETWREYLAAGLEPKRIDHAALGVSRTGVYARVTRLLNALGELIDDESL